MFKLKHDLDGSADQTLAEHAEFDTSTSMYMQATFWTKPLMS